MLSRYNILQNVVDTETGDAKGQTRRVTNLVGPLKTQACLGFVMVDPSVRRLRRPVAVRLIDRP